MTIRVCLFVLALLSFAAAPTFGEYADWKFDAEQFEARLFDDWLMQDVPNAEERAALFADVLLPKKRALSKAPSTV